MSNDSAEQDVLVAEILQMNLKAVRGDTRNSGVRTTDKIVLISEADYTLVGKEVVRETSYYVLKITLADVFETYKYVNEDTWLVDMSRDFVQGSETPT